MTNREIIFHLFTQLKLELPESELKESIETVYFVQNDPTYTKLSLSKGSVEIFACSKIDSGEFYPFVGIYKLNTANVRYELNDPELLSKLRNALNV